MGFVGYLDGMTVLQQTLATGAQLACLFVDAALLSSQNPDLMLHLSDADALLVGSALRQTPGVFQFGQLRGVVFQLRGQQLGFFRTQEFQLRQARQLRLRFFAALASGAAPVSACRRDSTRCRPSTT